MSKPDLTEYSARGRFLSSFAEIALDDGGVVGRIDRIDFRDQHALLYAAGETVVDAQLEMGADEIVAVLRSQQTASASNDPALDQRSLHNIPADTAEKWRDLLEELGGSEGYIRYRGEAWQYDSVRLDDEVVIVELSADTRRAHVKIDLAWDFFGGLVLLIADLLMEFGTTIHLPADQGKSRQPRP